MRELGLFLLFKWKHETKRSRLFVEIGSAADPKQYCLSRTPQEVDKKKNSHAVFVGYLLYAVEIKVYDIPKRKWMDNIPKLKAPTCYPLVFFIDHWLYVISFDIPEGGQPHFEMLNMSYLSKRWVSLPLPNTLLYPVVTYKLATLIVDGGHSNETTLYLKAPDSCVLLAFSFKD
ncbi:hypothetical protein FXO38_05841 [Capsicum annuum]